MQSVQRDVPSPAGLGLDTIRVPDGAPIALDLQLQAVTEGVLVTGTVGAPVVGECGRCLNPLEQVFAVDLVELFAYPDSVTDQTTDEDEVERIEDDLIDLEPAVRDAIVLGLPITPLCRIDCAGLCPTCGQRLDDVEPGHSHDLIDPRWAGLASRLGPEPPDSIEEH